MSHMCLVEPLKDNIADIQLTSIRQQRSCTSKWPKSFIALSFISVLDDSRVLANLLLYNIYIVPSFKIVC